VEVPVEEDVGDVTVGDKLVVVALALIDVGIVLELSAGRGWGLATLTAQEYVPVIVILLKLGQTKLG
jgi:hypothetical protein